MVLSMLLQLGFPGVAPGMLVVFAIILAALFFFTWERVPVDITAIGVMVALMVLGEWTQISPRDGVSGFSNPATITVLAMMILSEGVQRTGAIQILSSKISELTGDSPSKQLAAIIGVVSPISGFINNTAAVAILIPMVGELAEKSRVSPSKLLIPLSYASMFGGMLTLIGTSTNILASDVAARLADEAPGLRGFTMFEFTHLGIIVTLVGAAYLWLVGHRLLPERIKPAEDLTAEYEMGEYLTEVTVLEESPLAGKTVNKALDDVEVDVDVLQIIREENRYVEPLARKEIREGDTLMVRTDRDTLLELMDTEGLDLVPDIEVDDNEIESEAEGQELIEVVLAPGASIIGETLETSTFRERYDGTVLALRRGIDVIHERLDEIRLSAGDTLLIQATQDTVDRLSNNRDFILVGKLERPDYRKEKIPIAIGIVIGVVVLAALGVLDIMVAALAGGLGMLVTRCLKPSELYESIYWDVIFLLAGVIPLGIALERTGGAELLGDLVVISADFMPPILVLGTFYLLTAFLTNVISNNASVVLMIPVAVEAAVRMDVNAFAFVLAVTFAASTAFMTPMGYQTNLFVYGPGGYKFTDYVRVGGPLQLLLAAVTTVGITYFWGL